MKKIMDAREHIRARSAREQLLNVKEEQRIASEAKTDCEEKIRLLMEELQQKQKEQESLVEDMSSSAKKAKYLEEQIKRRDTALSKKTPKSDRGTGIITFLYNHFVLKHGLVFTLGYFI